ncbi:protein KRI1 homolog [Homarus americanus]|uniref:protein KRI1 homolog n=1 Tax=Homarus americanus TaxID=6706 RepID=UPI001C474BB1|nr:protein KRI1 homolog [Homarus americanus]
MSQKKILFDEDSGGEEDGLQINKAYATKYEEWRRGEELEKLKNQYGNDGSLTSDSESSSDDDFVEPDNPDFDRDFFISLGALYKKNGVNLEERKFFSGDYRKKKKDKEEKAMTIHDYQRYIAVDHEGNLDEDDDPTAEKDVGDSPLRGKNITGFNDDEDDKGNDDDDDDDGLLTSGLFKVKEKSPKKKKEEPSEVADDVVAYVKGESSTISNEKDKGLLEGLKSAWNDPNLSSENKWLADYFLNKRYLEDEDETIERAYNEVVIDEETLSEDERTLEKMETFENKYRFRFEEPDEEFIKRYPRSIPDSVRAKDERRKLTREAQKQRKKEEKELKRKEIEKLKALKYKEIEAKIMKIKEVSGNNDIDLGEKELDDDFDPAAHDGVMSRMFGDDYYVDDGDTEKPVFSDDEDIIQDYDEWMERQGPGTTQNAGDCEADEEDHVNWDGDNFNMDADYDPSQAKEDLQKEMINASTRKKGRRKSKFAKAISKNKPIFDPKEKNFDSYFDEYYQLDFEDIIGDIPCRFKYRKVESNDFGLTTEEILTAQDKELNRWVSLKKMLQYQRTNKDEQQDRIKCRKRAEHLHVKQKILPSLFVEDPEELQITEQEKKRQKNLKKKLRREKRQQGRIDENVHNDQSSAAKETKVLHNNETSNSNKRQLEHANEDLPKKKKKRAGQNELDFSDSPQTSNTKVLPDESMDENTHSHSEQNKHYSQENLQKIADISLMTEEAKKSEAILNVSELGDSLPQKKKKKKKKKTNLVEAENTEIKKSESEVVSSKKRKKNKNRQGQIPTALGKSMKSSKKKKIVRKNDPFFQGLSDARLSAYGENPKKFKNSLKYGKQNV